MYFDFLSTNTAYIVSLWLWVKSSSLRNTYGNIQCIYEGRTIVGGQGKKPTFFFVYFANIPPVWFAFTLTLCLQWFLQNSMWHILQTYPLFDSQLTRQVVSWHKSQGYSKLQHSEVIESTQAPCSNLTWKETTGLIFWVNHFTLTICGGVGLFYPVLFVKV